MPIADILPDNALNLAIGHEFLAKGWKAHGSHKLAEAHAGMAESWRDYAEGTIPLELCDGCGDWVPGSATVSHVTKGSRWEMATVRCLFCEYRAERG